MERKRNGWHEWCDALWMGWNGMKTSLFLWLLLYIQYMYQPLQTIWCNHSTSRYELFVGVAILVYYKPQLMQCSTVESLMEVRNACTGL